MSRKQKQQMPPPGIAYIEDVTDPITGAVIVLGIASRLGITPGTYRKWRMAGKGPASTFLIGKRVAAFTADIDAWLIQQRDAALTPNHEMRPPEPRMTAPHGGRRRHVDTVSAAA